MMRHLHDDPTSVGMTSKGGPTSHNRHLPPSRPRPPQHLDLISAFVKDCASTWSPYNISENAIRYRRPPPQPMSTFRGIIAGKAPHRLCCPWTNTAHQNFLKLGSTTSDSNQISKRHWRVFSAMCIPIISWDLSPCVRHSCIALQRLKR
jgi:hypothetical protein